MVNFKGSILIVEDLPVVAGLLKAVFEDANYTCLQAANISVAKKQISQNGPDLVVSDFNLPDGTASDLLSWLETKSPKLPVIVLSGAGANKLNELEKHPSVRAALGKPVENSALLKAVKKHLTKLKVIKPDRIIALDERLRLLEPLENSEI